MKKLVLALLLCLGSVAVAQPVPVTWRPPTTCSTNDALKWSGTAWVCSGGAFSIFTGTTNYLPKRTGVATYGDSVVNDVSGLVGISVAAPKGLFSVASTTAHVSTSGFGSFTTWDQRYSIFGPNVGSATGGALGLGYSTVDDASNIVSIAPNVAWKPLRLVGSQDEFWIGGTSGARLAIDATVFDVNNQLSKFGSTADGEIYFFEDEANCHYADDSNQTCYYSYSGFNHGSTRFRSSSFRDGKASEIVLFDGPTHNVTLNSGGTGTTGIGMSPVSTVKLATQMAIGASFSDAGNFNLALVDSTATAKGVGGNIGLNGAYTGSTTTNGAVIKTEKSNGKDTDYDFDLAFGTRRNGSTDITKRLLIDATGATNMLGEGVGVGGIHASYLGPDYTDVFYSGLLRKNLSLYSAVVGDDVATDGHWRHVNGTATLVYATDGTQTPPRGYQTNVGKITCTGATCSSSGAQYQYTATSATTFITDTRSKTFTLSVFVKTASGTNTAFLLALGRYNDNEFTSTTCTVNSTTWTRCTATKTFSATSYADNSELRAYLYPENTTAHYISDAQIELGSDWTPIEDTTSNIGGHAAAYNAFPLSSYSAGAGGDVGYGIYSASAGFGGSGVGLPAIALGPSGDIGARSISVGQSGTGVPGGTTFYGVDTELTSSFGTGSTAYTVYGIKAVASDARSSGTGAITNKAGYFDSQNGQTNIAVESDHGNNYLNTTSGNTCVGIASGGTCAAKLTLTGDATISSTLGVTGTLTASSATNKGTITLVAGSGTATVASGAVCACSDRTANASVKCVVATTTLTATGTGTDSIAYVCL